jgi:hypothetical protein
VLTNAVDMSVIFPVATPRYLLNRTPKKNES